MSYQVPVVNQNQHVEVAYRWAGECILRRSIDHSPEPVGGTWYAVARLTGAEVERLATWHPGGDDTPDLPETRWEEITAAQAARIAEGP